MGALKKNQVSNLVEVGIWQSNPVEWVKVLSEYQSTTDRKRYIGIGRQDGSIGSNISYTQLQLEQMDWKDLKYTDHFMTINQMAKAEVSKTIKGKSVKQVRMARTSKNVVEANWLWVDIDFKHYTESMDYFIEEVPKLPIEPSLILMSGRGIWCLWRIETIYDMSHWKALERGLASSLGQEVDLSATDPSRYCRIPGSINSKSGQVVQFMKMNDTIYTKEQIAEAFKIKMPKPKPVTREATKPTTKTKRKFKSKVVHNKNIWTLNLARCEDLEKLVRLRKGNMIGHRDNLLFIYGWHYQLSQYSRTTKEEVFGKLERINNLFTDPLDIPILERMAEKISQYMLEEDEKGNPKYNYTNEKICELLEITLEESEQMSTILLGEDKKNRKTERMRKYRGGTDMDTYKDKRVQEKYRKMELIIGMKDSGYTNKAIQEELKISKAGLYKLLKEINSTE